MAEKVVVQLVLDTSRYTGQAQKAAASTGKITQSADKTTGAMSKMQGTALKAGAALGAAFAAKTVLDFAKSSIAAFSNLEESVNAVNVIYGEGSAAIVELGETSATQFGLSTTAVNEAAVAMGAFAEKIDAADPPGAFQNVLQRATDFASVMNLETNEALRLFQSGLAGESEPLRRFGVDVSAATVNAEGLAAGLGGANGKLSEGEKVQARYLTIMKQTTKVTGDFANTSDSLANRQKILGAQWREMQATIGKELAPAMTKLLGVGVKLIPIFAKLGPAIGSAVDDIIPLVDVVTSLTDRLGLLTDSTEENEASVGVTTQAWDAFTHVITQAQVQETLIAPAIGIVNDVLAVQEPRLSAVNTALSTTVDRAREHATSMGLIAAATPPATEAQDTLARSASNAAEQFQAEADAIRDVARAQAEAASPILRLIRANQQIEKAEQKLTETRADGEATADDILTAELDLIDARINLETSAAALAGVMGESREAFVAYALAAGLSVEQTAALIAIIDGVERVVDIQFNVSVKGAALLDQLTGPARRGRGDDKIEAKQHGGPVTAGDPFIVGEAGPELFIPNRDGRIVANNKLGGGGVTVNVNQPTTTDLASDISAGLIAGQVTQLVEGLRV